MAAEFADRFGPLPEMVQNLFYQLKVKLRAEAAGLASVSIESDQFVLRYPPLPRERTSATWFRLGGTCASGKMLTGYLMPPG